jgi:hypothetical protein
MEFQNISQDLLRIQVDAGYRNNANATPYTEWRNIRPGEIIDVKNSAIKGCLSNDKLKALKE